MQHAIGDVIPVRAQSKRRLIAILHLPVSAKTNRRDYKKQNALLLDLNKALWELPPRRYFYRVVQPGDLGETAAERTVREWSEAVEDIKAKKRTSKIHLLT